MSGAGCVRQPQEAQKAKVLWAMKAAKDRKEFYDLAREEDISRINKTRFELWEEHLKDPMAALDKALKCVDSQYWSWLEALWKQGSNDQRWVVSDLMLPLWEEVLWLSLDAWDGVRLRTTRNGMSQGDTGRAATSSSSLLLRELVRLGPASGRMA